MAKIDEVSARVGTLETKVNFAGSVVSLLILGALAWLSSTIVTLKSDLRAFKQAEKDRGVEIVSQIANPQNVQQQQVALITAGADLKRALIEKRVPRPEKLQPLTAALQQSTSEPNVQPEAWNTAAALINYRSAAYMNFAPRLSNPCFASRQAPDESHGVYPRSIARASDRSCTFDLNDFETFEHSGIISDYKRHYPGYPPPISLWGATILLDPSKPIINIASIQCSFCNFVIEPGTPERQQQRTLLRQLLALNSANVTFDIPQIT